MLQEELRKVKIVVDDYLKDFFAEKKHGIGAVHPEVAKMIEDIEDVTLRGGDRFRPFMVWLGQLSVLGCQLSERGLSVVGSSVLKTGKQKTDKLISENRKPRTENRDLLKLMASVELLHSFALIHDDIIDRAETRRGGPTIKPDEKALLAGDMCFTFADELLNGMPVAVKKIYDDLREEVIAGEWLDVLSSNSVEMHYCASRDQKQRANEMVKSDHGGNFVGETRSSASLLSKIYEYKTARYTFLRPFEMGYQFALYSYNICVNPLKIRGNPGAKKQDEIGLKMISRALIDIGIAFQMRDDYLDLFGDSRLGKKIGGDLKEGKLTLWHVFGNPKLTQGSVEKVKEQMEKLGIKQKVEREMRRISDKAKGMIEEIKELKGETKQLLMEMAEFVVGREY